MRKERIKKLIEENGKVTTYVYLFLRLLVIICMIREIANGNIFNALLCVLSLVMFLLPFIVEKTFKVNLPPTLEIMILIFIYSAEILGEINNFYGIFANFDQVLHIINGFLAASVGFSLIYLLNENIHSIKLSPIFVSIVAFCFSMTIGVIWEFFEYGMDKYFNFDMQKDTYVDKINTVIFNDKNEVYTYGPIEHTIIYNKKNDEIKYIEGYLDIGLNDTMEDLWVNFIGAFVYSIFGYLYIVNKEKYKLVEKFMTTKNS